MILMRPAMKQVQMFGGQGETNGPGRYSQDFAIFGL